MSLKLLLKVNRLCHLFKKDEVSSETEKLLVDVLHQIIESSQSPLVFSIELKNLTDRIKEKCNPTLMILIERYQTKLRELLNEVGVDSLNQLTPENIGHYYDNLLSQYQRPQDINDCHYNDVYELLINRDITVCCSTNEFHHVQPDIIGSLYSIDPDFLPFHDKNKLQHLRDTMIFKFNDYQTVGTWQYTLDRCKSIIQSHILENDNDIDVDVESDEKNKKWLTDLESEAYWTIRWWVVYSMFLTGEYSLVVTNFFDLLSIEKTQAFIQGDSITALKKIDSDIIDVTSLLRVVYLSTLVSQNNIGENKVFKILSQSNLFETDKTIKKLRDDIHVFEMKKVQNLLLQIEKEIPWIHPLEKSFKHFQKLIIQKSLLTYLTCIQQATFVELSQTFNMEVDEVKSTLLRLLALLDLPYIMDNKTGVIYYSKRNMYLQEDKIQTSIREEAIRYNKIKTNKIVSTANESDTEDH